MPICSKCQQDKPYRDFHRDMWARSGHRSACKACIKPLNRRYNQKWAQRKREESANAN